MGLSAISIPNATINLEPFKELNKPLLNAKWLKVHHASAVTSNAEMNLTFQDIQHDNNRVDGMSLVRALIFKFDQVTNFKSAPGASVRFDNGKKCLL